MKKLLFLWVLILTASQASAQFTGLPVTLSQPYDKEVLEDNEPLLVWQTDLSTVIDNPRVSIRLTLVEILKDQTPAEAIQINKPILIRDDLKSNTWSYSSTDTELQPGHHYAWQVTISFNSVMVQQSEVWEFSILEPSSPTYSYYSLRQHSDLSYAELSEPVFRFLTEEKGSLDLKCTLTAENGEVFPVVLTELKGGKPQVGQVVSTGGGTRYFELNMQSLNLSKGKYTLQWHFHDQKNKTIQLILS